MELVILIIGYVFGYGAVGTFFGWIGWTAWGIWKSR